MPDPEIDHLVAGCTRFLAYHYPRSLRERMQAIADSPLSLQKPDMYGVGGVVADLEREIADLLGKEAAVFMPSGTMAQQIALRIWADEAGNPRIAFHPTCHLEIHEQGAYRELHDLKACLVGEPGRLFTLEDLRAVETPSVLLIELPQREIGGQLPSWQELGSICDWARSQGIKLHMDGARLWECAPYYRRSYAEIAGPFDSVYVSFYKILGGLPGAALAGPSSLIERARVWQRRHGGNLHQQSPNAISAKLGMADHLPRIGEYVARAGEFAKVFREFPQVRVVPEEPPTNMMHLYFSCDSDSLLESAKRIAREDQVLLFLRVGAGGKLELTVGEAGLDISPDELRGLLRKLLV